MLAKNPLSVRMEILLKKLRKTTWSVKTDRVCRTFITPHCIPMLTMPHCVYHTYQGYQ